MKIYIGKKWAKVLEATDKEKDFLKAFLNRSKRIPRRGGVMLVTINLFEYNKFPTKLIKTLHTHAISKGHKMQYSYDDSFKKSLDKGKINAFIHSLGLPFKPHPYQLDMLFEMLKSDNASGDISMGGGKTYINYLYTLCMSLKKRRVLIVVPQVSLATQMFLDFQGFKQSLHTDSIGDIDVIYNNSNRVSNAMVTIGNVASLVNMLKTDPDFFKGFDSVIFDEADTVIGKAPVKNYRYANGLPMSNSKNVSGYAKILRALHSGGVRGVYAYTGTVPIQPLDYIAFLGIFGDVKVSITSKDLTELGQNADPTYIQHCIKMPVKESRDFAQYKLNFLNCVNKSLMVSYKESKPYLDTLSDKHKFRRQKRFDNSFYLLFDTKEESEAFIKDVEDRVELGVIKKSHVTFSKMAELDTTRSLLELNYFQQNDFYFETFYKEYSSFDENENQLIFVANLSNLNTLREKLEARGHKVLCFYGAVSPDEREKIKAKIENGNGYTLIALYQVMAVGVSVKKLHRMHFYSPCKSFKRFMQSFGRIVRKHPEIPNVAVHDWYYILNGISDFPIESRKELQGYSFAMSKERKKMLHENLKFYKNFKEKFH